MDLVIVTIGVLICSILIFLLYTQFQKRYCTKKIATCVRDLTGKTVIITGANAGIGFYTALDLAERNARVILACRNLDKAKMARAKIHLVTKNDQIVVKQLDLSSFKSVRRFAEEIKREEERLDILINNAGVLGLSNEKSEDGLEMTMATNHFGPFLLTNLLLDLLIKSAPSRIVTLSSLGHMWGKMYSGETSKSSSFLGGQHYADSKLANVLFMRELSKRLLNTGVTANSVHPGTVSSELYHNLPAYLRWIFTLISVFMKSSTEGAMTTIYCATSDEVSLISGKYFSDCRVTSESKLARNNDAASKLWEISEKITGIVK